MFDPRISVVIPVYNGERFLGEAIGSVLSQAERPLEVIVIDDGSTDGSAEVARAFPSVNYVYQANAGQAEARNQGAALATGEFLAFLDADDVWMPDKLTWQLAAFAAEPHLDAVFGHAEQFVEAGSPHEVAEKLRILPAQLPSAMLIRRQRFLQLGGYPTGLRVAEVVDWYARALESGLKAITLDQVVYRRRIHGANTTLRNRPATSDYLAVVRSALRRRRSAAIPASNEIPG